MAVPHPAPAASQILTACILAGMDTRFPPLGASALAVAIGCGNPDGGGSGDASGSSTSTDPMTDTLSPTSTTPTTTVADGSTSTTDDGSEDSSEATSDPDTSSSSTTGTPAFCGNAMTEDPEACDDGNDVDGDGCNADCLESGTIVWQQQWDGPIAGTDWGEGVAIDSQAGVAFVGQAEVAADLFDVAIVRYDADGRATWEQFVDGAQADVNEVGNDFARRVAFDGDDRLLVTGRLEDGQTFPWLGEFGGDGTPGFSEQAGDPGFGRALAVDGSGGAVVGTSGLAAGRLLHWSQAGDPSWGVPLPPSDPGCVSGCSRVTAATVVGDAVIVGGTRRTADGEFDAFVAAYNLASNSLWVAAAATPAAADETLAIGQLGDGSIVAMVAVAGYTAHELRTYSTEGDELDVVPLGFDGIRMQSATVVPGDELVIGGWTDYGNDVLDGWIARVALDGTARWTRDLAGSGATTSLAISDVASDGAGRIGVVGGTWDPADELVSDAWIAVITP